MSDISKNMKISISDLLRDGLIQRFEFTTNVEMWLSMLNDRSSTADIYSEQKAIQICDNIVSNT